MDGKTSPSALEQRLEHESYFFQDKGNYKAEQFECPWQKSCSQQFGCTPVCGQMEFNILQYGNSLSLSSCSLEEESFEEMHKRGVIKPDRQFRKSTRMCAGSISLPTYVEMSSTICCPLETFKVKVRKLKEKFDFWTIIQLPLS
ncbi:uncharacterized protein GJ701_013480 isoform 1-T1 [Geothlypis trichas]